MGAPVSALSDGYPLPVQRALEMGFDLMEAFEAYTIFADTSSGQECTERVMDYLKQKKQQHLWGL